MRVSNRWTLASETERLTVELLRAHLQRAAPALQLEAMVVAILVIELIHLFRGGW